MHVGDSSCTVLGSHIRPRILREKSQKQILRDLSGIFLYRVYLICLDVIIKTDMNTLHNTQEQSQDSTVEIITKRSREYLRSSQKQSRDYLDIP